MKKLEIVLKLVEENQILRRDNARYSSDWTRLENKISMLHSENSCLKQEIFKLRLSMNQENFSKYKGEPEA